MPRLPLLADPARYRPCIQDLLADGPEVLDYWLTLFERHVETLAALPVGDGRLDTQPAWAPFRRDYLAGLADLRRRPNLRGRLSVLELTRYRDEKLAAHAMGDPFADLKARENALAMRLYDSVIAEVDAAPPTARWDLLARGLFAGNLFDMGSRAAVDAFASGGYDFRAARARIPRRPWPVDGLEAWQMRAGESDLPWRQALFFVDNAGPDIILGAIPLARELARRGTHVVLAANSTPALNDITADELAALLPELAALDAVLNEHVRSGRVAVVASGCMSPLIDLSALSQSCCDAAATSDLLILEGMGRAIESNYDAVFTVDAVKLALVKDPMVAKVIGVSLFDPVFRFERTR